MLSQMAEGGGFLVAMLQSFKLFVKKYFVSFLLFGIVGASAATGYWFLKPAVYEAEMTVSYVHYEKKIYADMVEKLDLLVDSKGYSTLSQILSLPIEAAEELKSIKGYNIRNEELVDDLSTEKIPFYIIVRVTNNQVLDDLEPAIVKYLDGTKFIQDRVTYMKQKSEKELVFLTNRLAIVDSLSRILLEQNNKFMSEKSLTRMDLLQEALEIYLKIQEVEGSLAFNKNIEVLDGFIANERPVGKGLATLIIYGFIGGLVLRFLVLIFS